MFTRFSTSQRTRPAPVAGTLVSLAAHAVLVVVVVGGGPSGAGSDAAPAGAPGDDGERLHWVGTGGDPRGDASTPSATGAARPPIAYVVPGRGPLRETTRPVVPRRAARPSRGDPADQRRPDPRRLKFWRRELAPLPPLPAVDAAVLVVGVAAAAPDLNRLVSRPEDFRRFRPSDAEAELLMRASVLTPNGPRPVGPVDVLPVAYVSNPKPMYPMRLAQSGVGGRVLVEFTIDSAGVVDLATLEVVGSTNALFTQAVRAVLPQLRFLPAQVAQHAVGVRVRQPFEFRVRGGGGY